jgi:hypothetical protein
LLRTEDQLLAEAMAHLGFQRRGPNIVAAISDAIARARHPETTPPRSPRPGREPRGRRSHAGEWRGKPLA